MRITELPATHVADAVALWEVTGLTRPWNDAHADLRRAMAGPASTVLAALGEEGPIGIAMPGHARHDEQLLGTAMVGHDGHRGWVYYLAVAPHARRHGLGRTLVQACERWVRERDIPKIQLMVRHTNAAAVCFYEALGYADTETVVLGRRLDA